MRMDCSDCWYFFLVLFPWNVVLAKLTRLFKELLYDKPACSDGKGFYKASST